MTLIMYVFRGAQQHHKASGRSFGDHRFHAGIEPAHPLMGITQFKDRRCGQNRFGPVFAVRIPEQDHRMDPVVLRHPTLSGIDPAAPFFQGQGKPLEMDHMVADLHGLPWAVRSALGTVEPGAGDPFFELGRTRNMAFPAMSGTAGFIQKREHGEIVAAPGRGAPGAGIVRPDFFHGIAQAVVCGTEHHEKRRFSAVFMFMRTAAVNPDLPFAGDHHRTVGKTRRQCNGFGLEYLVVKMRIFHGRPFLFESLI